MSISELLRVHVPPGFKELVRDVATEHGQSLAPGYRVPLLSIPLLVARIAAPERA